MLSKLFLTTFSLRFITKKGRLKRQPYSNYETNTVHDDSFFKRGCQLNNWLATLLHGFQ
jgi:hypothetical protein